MKKIIKPFLIPALALSMMLAPTSSQAIVAIFNPAVLVAGLASFVVGTATFIPSGIDCAFSNCSPWVDALTEISSLTALGGFILLDAHQNVAFAPLSESQAKKMDLTAEEFAAYNNPDQLDTINLIGQEIQSQTQGIEESQKAVQISHDLWEKMGGSDLDPAAFSAIKKLGAALFLNQ